jgi:rubrerythrin
MDRSIITRRDIIKAGFATGAVGMMGFALSACSAATPTQGATGGGSGLTADQAMQADIAILNVAVGLEMQAVWAYTTAAATGKLNGDDALTTMVRNLALQNADDHKQHADALAAAVRSMGGTPTAAKSDYMDGLKPYLDRGEGNLDSLVNIAKLALALETDAALAYQQNVPKLSTEALRMTGTSILPDESAHAAAIRVLLAQAGVSINRIVASTFITPANREAWILKV